MKVVAFSGSARKGGNTALMLQRVLGVLEAEGIETELIELAGQKAQGCTVCLKCRERADRRCHGRNDAISECIVKAGEADGIIIGSPVYFADITPETKALIDRLGYVAGANPGMLERKVGAAVVVERRAGAVHAFDSIMHLFMIRQMIVAGSLKALIADRVEVADIITMQTGPVIGAHTGPGMLAVVFWGEA